MTSGDFHAQITKTAKRCNFPKKEAEERTIRDGLYRGINSTCVGDKAINYMNNDNGELTIEFLMQHLEIEDSNFHHKSLSQLDSTTSVNFAAYDCRQNKGSKSKKTISMENNWDRNQVGITNLLILHILQDFQQIRSESA